MDASQEFVIANIGQQDCIEDLTTMNKSSTKCHEEDEQLFAWDDATGAMLDPDLLMEARKAEMVYFKKMNVYEKVPKSECYMRTSRMKKIHCTDPDWSPRITTTPRNRICTQRRRLWNFYV